MKNTGVYLAKLRDDEMFQQILKEKIIPKRPVISPYDHTNDNTEKWKSDSLMQQGFDLCLTSLGIPKEFYNDR